VGGRPSGADGTTPLKDPRLHELLALVDALRVGRAREKSLAAEELERRLGPKKG